MFFIFQESYTYRDPITEFLECLYVNFDFDGAQQKLRECETVRDVIHLFGIRFIFSIVIGSDESFTDVQVCTWDSTDSVPDLIVWTQLQIDCRCW